ncbi:MAG: type II toxin-antitoxin system VapC family toxin [Cyclobacteriaceae bacterium]|nr:type II toxin-antitoxin system VapC family toxin [Cyclobacteriaceae bacterium]
MAKRYLIDTNVIIDFSANLIPKKGSSLLSICFDEEPIISVITKIELLGYPLVTTEVKDLVSTSLVVGLTDEIVNQTIQIRKQYKIKLPDSVIAATALTLDLILLSRNTVDFSKIKALNHLNPYKL